MPEGFNNLSEVIPTDDYRELQALVTSIILILNKNGYTGFVNIVSHKIGWMDSHEIRIDGVKRGE